jgi:hypothetical protein
MKLCAASSIWNVRTVGGSTNSMMQGTTIPMLIKH